MAVIDLRGEIGSNIALIGKSIGKVIRDIKGPDAKDRRAFFQRIEEDPELFNKFGKIARNNPGVLQQMFPFLQDNDIKQFRATLPSLEDLQEEVARPALTPVEQGGTLTPETGVALGEALRAEGAGLTASELAIQPKEVIAAEAIPQEAVTAGLRRDVTGFTPGREAQDKFDLGIFNSALESFKDLTDDDKLAASLRDELPAAFFDADNKEMFRKRKILAQMQIDAASIDRYRERIDSSERAISARWVERTKTGVPETWQLFLFTQEMNDRAKGLAAGTIIPQNELDIRLIEVANSFSRASQVDKSLDEAAIKTQIAALIDNISQVGAEGGLRHTRSVRQVYTELLNSKFVEINLLTDGRIPIRVGEIPDRFGPGKGNEPLRIRDESGEEIEIGQPVPAEVEARNKRLQVESQGFTPPLILNLETVDISKLPQKTRDNLIAIMTGQGTFEELKAFDPISAQLILDARRDR